MQICWISKYDLPIVTQFVVKLEIGVDVPGFLTALHPKYIHWWLLIIVSYVKGGQPENHFNVSRARDHSSSA